MTAPERLQDVTLAERLLRAARTLGEDAALTALLKEAAAALSGRGDDGMEMIESAWLDRMAKFIGPSAMAYLSREHEAHRRSIATPPAPDAGNV